MSDENRYGKVNAGPVKRFFVEMLTRDIAVEDAILDLLDNCVDGILRAFQVASESADSNRTDEYPPLESETPYNGFWAKINLNSNSFEIKDNCGGIPWSEHDRAFRMGRPATTESGQDNIGPQMSVGVYGIGMKRAIFKMGDEAIIRTKNGSDSYQIPITSQWMSAENIWDLDVLPEIIDEEDDGTSITVRQLHNDISERFDDAYFIKNLIEKVQSHYTVIIQKGFKVEINGTEAKPKPFLFRYDPELPVRSQAIRPYIFKTDYEGVDIFVAIGLRDPVPDAERLLGEQQGVQRSSNYAGWTVICNDRVVLYCNRDELTGWGTARIPRYHTQFISISGVVEFKGDPRKLPTTTTKRGLDYSSSMYQQVLERMREGLRVFIDYTNDWKAREEEAKVNVNHIPAITYAELKQRATSLDYRQTKVGIPGEQFKPKLPEPPNDTTDRRISYSKEIDQIMMLADRLLPELDDLPEKTIPRRVGEASFDYAYRRLVGEAGEN